MTSLETVVKHIFAYSGTQQPLIFTQTCPDITAGLEADLTKWDVYATSFDWKGDWETSTRYKIDDIVRYGGISYVCNTGHQSAATGSSGDEGLEGVGC